MSEAIIDKVLARRIWDSRGRPTVEVEIATTDGVVGRSAAPAGASTGSGEALDLRDGGSPLAGYNVRTAVQNVQDRIAPSIKGMNACDQSQIDHTLQVLDGTETCGVLGGNAMIATSMAVAHAAANATRQPLWAYVADKQTPIIPVPEVQIFGGGAHAGGAIDLQDFMIVPFGAGSFDEALTWTAEIYIAAGTIMRSRGAIGGVADEGGYWPDFQSNEHAIETLALAIEKAGFCSTTQVGISLDIAATQFFEAGRYYLNAEARALGTEDWLETLCHWLRAYPVVMIEDPFEEGDIASHAELTHRFGDQLQIVADDLTVTSADRVRKVSQSGACSALLCKPNQAGTLTRAREAFDAARQAGWGTIISARSGETEDTTIAHLAVGWASGQFKVGSFARSERMAKWNEMLRIEEALGADARYAGSSIYPWMVGTDTPSGGGVKVLFHYDVGEQLDRYLRGQTGDEIELVYCRQEDDARFADEIQSADALWHVLKPVTQAHIERAANLKLIQKIGVGVNTIDLDAAKDANVAVCNMPGTNSRAVAEMTLMLMLAALRLQPRLDALSRSGQWHPEQATAEALGEINGRTIGLVGFGGVAEILAPILCAMGATVIYTSQSPKRVGFEFAELDDLLRRAEIVSLHVPLTAGTERLLDARRLALMKQGSILINTARGGLVDENALLEALSDGRLHAAGLDVFATEPAHANNPLFKLDNVVPAPHVAWLTMETWHRSLKVALQNTHAIRTGAALQHRIV